MGKIPACNAGEDLDDFTVGEGIPPPHGCEKGSQHRGAVVFPAAFLELAEMEDAHERAFAEMRAALGAAETQTSTFDPEGQTAAYLAAMADANVFGPDTDPVDLVCDKSAKELLKIAIDLEKESIVFYLGLRDLVSAPAGQDKVERILQEEMAHVAMLRGKIAALA